MNRVQDLINQLHAVVGDDRHLADFRRNATQDKIDELDAWLSWLGVKERSGVIGEENQKTGFPTQFKVTLEQFFVMVDTFKDQAGCEINIPISNSEPLTVVVRAGEDDNDPHTYTAPSRNSMTQEELTRFWGEFNLRGWIKSLRAQEIQKPETSKIMPPQELIPGNIVMNYWLTGKEFIQQATEHLDWRMNTNQDGNYQLTPPGNPDRVYVTSISERYVRGDEFKEFVEKRLR